MTGVSRAHVGHAASLPSTALVRTERHSRQAACSTVGSAGRVLQAPARRHIPIVIVLVLIGCAQARADSFDASHRDGFTLRLDGQVVIEHTHPLAYPRARAVPEKGGLTVGDEQAGMRAEIAWAAQRAELTWSYGLPAPATQEMIVRVPLPENATVTVVHATRDKRPRTVILQAGQRPADATFSLPRFVTVVLPDGSGFAVDPLPMGVWGLTGAAHDAQDRGLAMRFEDDGLLLSFFIAPTYQRWRATLRGKLAIHAQPVTYSAVHPWQYANYRYGFERVVKIGFTSAPMPKKAYERRSVTNDKYSAERGYGWVEGAEHVSIRATGVDGIVYRDRAEGPAPAVFRVDVPAGHYYLTLNFGSAEAATGPLTVSVNGRRRLTDFSLDKGRFRAVPLWVTTRSDQVRIRIEGVNGGNWQLNALTLSALGTLNEDYTLTRSWWTFGR